MGLTARTETSSWSPGYVHVFAQNYRMCCSYRGFLKLLLCNFMTFYEFYIIFMIAFMTIIILK